MNEYARFVTKGSIIKIFGREKYESVLKEYLQYNSFNKDIFLENTTIHNTIKPIENVIYISFHFGPFFNIPITLLRNRIDINFVASRLSTEKLDRFSHTITSEKLNFDKENILLGDTPTGMRKIIATLKNGGSVFSLIDTGVGLGDIRKSNNAQICDVLNAQLYAKSAIIQLAFKLKVPVVPVFSIWKNDHAVLSFEDPIYPSDETSPQEVTDNIWKRFVNHYLVKYPEQWESYHTVYKLFAFDDPEYVIDIEDKNQYIVDGNNFEIIESDGFIHICAYSTFHIFRASDRVRQFLNMTAREGITLKLRDVYEILKGEEIIRLLIENNILVKNEN
ncbi:hypothetical protein [Chryseobacterium sp.]|uniref:LpxL/LpxP family acyltransferase n=1 Tax=Chryseobacterium sp. TaxID=1871047 RepID=UPI0025BFDCA3|nr:hypothetical protein [Chryseobacterium sp.]MBV8324998.1 hypothetical protein [Chryseobacterium sp.]